MRARNPDEDGYVERDGVRIFYEVFGEGEPTVLLLPTWSIIHSRFWKGQVPYLARHGRVIIFDPRGNGKSSRPLDSAAYADTRMTADALAVMDATNTERAVVVALSCAANWALLMAAEHAERVTGVVFIGPSAPLTPHHPERRICFQSFDEVLATDEGWAKYNRHYWPKDYQGFLEFFFSKCFTEPHSTKQIEDCVGWALETTPEVLVITENRPDKVCNRKITTKLARQVQCPVLVIHGDSDAVIPHARGARLAELTGGTLVTLEGSGHIPNARDPVKVNLLLHDFIETVKATDATTAAEAQAAQQHERVRAAPQPLTWTRGRNHRKRVLYISSPIGLGHAQRDVAIAHELRKLHPDLEIDWLAQHPVTNVLEAHGERIHPASALLASESHHIECESAEHDLHCSSPRLAPSPGNSHVHAPERGKWIVSSARGV